MCGGLMMASWMKVILYNKDFHDYEYLETHIVSIFHLQYFYCMREVNSNFQMLYNTGTPDVLWCHIFRQHVKIIEFQYFPSASFTRSFPS